MTHELYSESDNWEVENDDQDVRGWNVVDQQGQTIGTVSDMYVDTQTETIDRLVLDNGSEIDVSTVRVEDGTIRMGAMGGSVGTDASYASGTGTTEYGSAQATGSAGSYGTGGASGTYGGGETGTGMGRETGTETYRAGDISGSRMPPGTAGTTTSSFDTQSGTSGSMGGSGGGSMGGSAGGGAMGGSGMGTSGDETSRMRSTDTLDASPSGGSTSSGSDAWRIRRQQGRVGMDGRADTTDMQGEKNYVEEPRSPDV
ncbi:MAG TPA: PRC-barrel domain-containing protein [Candidatus Limnocylindrales bacterium]|nr:PRC-barrel domain-containing protein [Candidatus Limnocylindrales bacterium]